MGSHSHEAPEVWPPVCWRQREVGGAGDSHGKTDHEKDWGGVRLHIINTVHVYIQKGKIIMMTDVSLITELVQRVKNL